jgi:3-methyladenine DNA glycosylase AlkC
MASGFSLKDQLFNAEKTRYLAGLFAGADAGFDAEGFEAQVMARLPELELKERISWIAEVLAGLLPADLPEAAPVILRALPAPLDPSKTDDDFGDFIFAPLGELVAAKTVEDHPELGLDLLEEITQRFSMEWAIRPFLNRRQDLTLDRMEAWTSHDSYHVRRLVSEGTRPRLPWGQAVGLGLADALPLLDRLHVDKTRYVTRSVANHLNDITKKEPDLVLDRLAGWQDAGAQDRAELDWMAAHALRGLVKSGHPEAMRMLGFDPDAPLEAAVEITGDARIGGALEFAVTLQAAARQPVLVDYIVHFQRPGGKVSPKVHKLKQAVITDGRLVLKKKHKLKGDATTFRLVPGAHRLEVQVNGRVCAAADFDLLEAAAG